MKEKLSALVDGELETGELHALLDELRKDSALRRQYGHYVRAQGSIHDENGPDIADRVWDRLQDEPAILAPRKKAAVIRRVAAGLAVAATVAGIAVGSLNWFAPLDNKSTLVASSPDKADYIRAGGTRWQVDDPKLEDDLNVYLVEHGGYAGSSAMNGVQSYVKVAGYDD